MQNNTVLMAVLLAAAAAAAVKDDRGTDVKPKENSADEILMESDLDLIAKASGDYFKCVMSPVDVGDLMDDYLNAKTANDLLAIPAKACEMMSQMKPNVADCKSIVDAFLDDGEKKTADNFPNVAEQLVSFLCRDNGKNLTTFLFNGGLSCTTKTESSTSECIRNISVDNGGADNTISDMSLIPFFKFDKYHCDIFSRVQRCVVREIQTCSPVTSSMFESLFAIARKSTPCSKFNVA